MTNTELRNALATAVNRLNELDSLTEILADVCGAAEALMGEAVAHGVPITNAELTWLKRKLGAAYRAGIKPTDYGPKPVDLTNEGGK